MIKFSQDPKKFLTQKNELVLVAPAHFYKKDWHKKILGKKLSEPFHTLISAGKLSGKPFTISHHFGKEMRKVTLIALSDQISWTNSPARKNETYSAIAKLKLTKKPDIIFGLDDTRFDGAAAGAAARALEDFNLKKSAKKKGAQIAFTDKEAGTIKPSSTAKSIASAVAWSCVLVDTPAQEMNPKSYAAEIKKRFKDIAGVKYKDIVGDKLLQQNFGGAHAVGRTAPEAPRVVILEYSPAKKSSAAPILLVGKGVTYDTGGLDLKIQGNMSNMKCDMAGSAAILGAFEVLVKNKHPRRVICIVGLVENAIGPHSYRPDDILHMHSGKTVEINNTDAEGRLVLADCMSYGCRTYKPAIAIEAATLTGAQLVATGFRHAGLVVNKKPLVELVNEAAQTSGDLISHLPFAPEFFQDEFSSRVADMRNSVKNRMNAQSSCAGQFVYSHIEDVDVDFVHIDLAGPAFVNQRATGYGVGLVSQIVSDYGV